MGLTDTLKYQIEYSVNMVLSSGVNVELTSYVESRYELRLDKSKITRLFTSMRPAYTEAEEHFVQKYLMCDEMVAQGMAQDGYGNCLIKVQNADGSDSKTLWSCHTDSVHRKSGVQEVHFDPLTDKFSTPDGSCLGADDNSGTYILLELLRKRIPGLYIFHRAEEVGGCGSSWIAQHSSELLEQYDRAIAFDRKDIYSIITHQGSKRCCSDEFADDLAEKLGMNHRTDSGGSFTDTANYDHIIPECTNLSVGYFNAHSARETQLLDYLWQLKDAFANMDCESLVTHRNPDAPVEYSSGGYYGYGDTLLKPHKAARSAMGWSKSDDIKWKEDTKSRKDTKSISDEVILDEVILDEILDEDYGPKATKGKHSLNIKDKDEPTEDSWRDFFGQISD